MLAVNVEALTLSGSPNQRKHYNIYKSLIQIISIFINFAHAISPIASLAAITDFEGNLLGLASTRIAQAL